MTIKTVVHLNFRGEARSALERGENSFFVSVRGETADEVTGYWDKLADGADITAPIGPAQWAPAYGMLTDKFGITWVLDVAVEYAG